MTPTDISFVDVAEILLPVLVATLLVILASLAYRVATKEQLPDAPMLIVALGIVAIYLNMRYALVEFVGDGANPVTFGEMILNGSVIVGAACAAYGGRRIGDRVSKSDRFRRPSITGSVSPLVRAAGRHITVTVPSEIGDIEGYDAIDDDTRKSLTGKTFTFPRGLTIGELQSQFASRLRDEYDVGYVDVEIDETATVTYLALGKRSRGLGPTLPTGTHAVAVRSDPAFSASPGDTIQIWQSNQETKSTRVGRGEFRAKAGRVATVATNEQTANVIDPVKEYRIMTLSAEANPEKEFAAMLRRADETMGIVRIDEGSPLVGSSIGALSVTTIAVSHGEEITTLPTRDYLLSIGDVLFTLGSPTVLRQLENAARDGGAPMSEQQTDRLLKAVGGTYTLGGMFRGDDAGRRDREDWTDYGEEGNE